MTEVGLSLELLSVSLVDDLPMLLQSIDLLDNTLNLFEIGTVEALDRALICTCVNLLVFLFLLYLTIL